MNQGSENKNAYVKNDNNSLSRSKAFINKASTKITNYREAFAKSKAGKVFSVLTGSAVSRTATIILAALTIAGVTAVAPQVAVAVGTLSLVAVGVGAVVSVYRTRTMRKLIEERNLLIKNRIALKGQNKVLIHNPKLANILKDQLLQSDTEENKQTTKRYFKENTNKALTNKAIAKTVLENCIGIAESLTTSIATGGLTVVTSVGLMAFNLVTDSKYKVDMDHAGYDLKKSIDNEKNQRDGPVYNKLSELRNAVNEQRTQTMVLATLVNDPSYLKMSESQILQRFNELKEEFNLANNVSDHQNRAGKALKIAKGIAADIGRAHNPFYKYNDPNKIKDLINSPENNVNKQAIFRERALRQSIKPLKEVLDSNKNNLNSLREQSSSKVRKQTTISRH